MDVELIRLPPGVPFVLDGNIYYREFSTQFGLVKVFPVREGIVDFKRPKYFDNSILVCKYERKRI